MPGYFAADSMVVRAMRQRAVGLTWGQRALVIGGLHPRLFVGTAQHTAHRATPYTRLSLTARLMESVFLGSREEADRALAFTAKRHVPVRGRTDVDGGPAHPAGSPYSAADPGLMWWTAAFALDSVEAQYDALVRPLRPEDRQELFEGFVAWACLFGMPASAAPSSYADFREGFDAWLASDEPHLVDEARLVGRHIAGMAGYHLPGGPLPSQTLRTVVQGSLPSRVRELYGIPWSYADEAAWRGIRTASRLAHGRLSLLGPSPLLRGRSEPFYKVVQRGEQSLVRRGGVSIPGVSDVQTS
jgi:uncharacterized protein (DUF2236 family)